MSRVTDAEVIESQCIVPRELLQNFGEQDDFARQHLLHPAIFALMGAVLQSIQGGSVPQFVEVHAIRA